MEFQTHDKFPETSNRTHTKHGDLIKAAQASVISFEDSPKSRKLVACIRQIVSGKQMRVKSRMCDGRIFIQVLPKTDKAEGGAA